MINLFKFSITLLLIPIFLIGCGVMGVVTDSKQNQFNDASYSWVCGKFYELEYFTGKREFVSKSDINAAIKVVADKNIKCKEYEKALYELDKSEKEKYLIRNANASTNKSDGALIGSALCLAFAKNATACTGGVAQGLEDEEDKIRRLQNVQKQNELKIRQLEEESQRQKRLLDEQNQKRDVLRNCSPSGKFC